VKFNTNELKPEHKANLIVSNIPVRLHKHLSIDAPARQVFEFWSNFANFQEFISMIDRIDVLDDITSHWIIRAPLGHEIIFTSTIVELEADKRLVWESVHHSGNARGELTLTQIGGRTRVELDFEYTLRHGWMLRVARLLSRHGFPSRAFDHGLERIRRKIEQETTQTSPDQGRSPRRNIT
jgi:uncharacterized membrane protein